MKKVSAVRTSAVYLVFAISGASALVYQVIWARWLGFVFGNTTLSVSIVLGSFMTGLALGSWLAGRLLHRINNPMLYYSLMELGIGIFALCFPLFSNVADLIFTSIVTSESSTSYSVLIRTLLSAAVLVIPTTLMGATLPLLTDFFHRNAEHNRNWKVGLLYAVNTLGAAVGIVIASFILIELIGVFATTYIAAGLNFTVALVGFRFSLSSGQLSRQYDIGDERSLDGMAIFAIAVITASGALALASEVLWTRTLETIIGNSTYAFASIVLLYLSGIAAGSWIMSLFVNRLRALPSWIAAMLLGMGFWTIISIKCLEQIGVYMRRYSADMVQLSTIFAHYAYALGILFPLALFSGACFPLATRIIDPRSEDAQGVLVAKAYSWNTIGAVVGSFAAGFVIAPFSDFVNSLYILAALYCLAGVVSYAVLGLSKWAVPYKKGVAAALGALCIIFTVFSAVRAKDKDYVVKRFNSNSGRYKIVFHEPGLQGVTSVVRNSVSSRRDVLLVNGMGMTIKVTDTKMMAHLPMLLHPDPQNTLVICFGMGTTHRSAVSYGKRVTVVELVKEVVDAAGYFHRDAAALKAYPRGRIVINDGRNFLKLTREKFDVITIDPPPPIDAAGVNSLYSREFIELAKEHLKKGGIMAHWMPFPGTLSGVDDLKTHDMLLATFAQVFTHTYVCKSLNGLGLHIVGSMQPINFSRDSVEEKLSNKAVFDDINEWDQVPASFLVDGWMKLPPDFLSKPGITDDKPFLEFYLFRALSSGGKKMHPINNIW